MTGAAVGHSVPMRHGSMARCGVIVGAIGFAIPLLLIAAIEALFYLAFWRNFNVAG